MFFESGSRFDVRIKKTCEEAVIPKYSSEFAAGADLYACIKEPVAIAPSKTVLIGTGISLELPVGFVGLVYARSGLASKQDLAPANKVGVIDCDYRGEIMVALHNHGDQTRLVSPGDRIAQLVITPYIIADFIECDDISDTTRGSGGFGSTGK